jgi:sugar diacid utilization regulator
MSGSAHHGTPDNRLAPAASSQVPELFERMARRLAIEEPLTPLDLDEIRVAGMRAAEEGLTAGEAVDLYLRTAAQLYGARPDGPPHHPTGHVLLEAVRAAVPVLVQSYQNAGRTMIRQEETARLEFVDDLLRGDADMASMVQRAEPFGLDLVAAHQVVLAAARTGAPLTLRDQALLTRAVMDQYGDRNVLVSTKANQLVAVVPATTDTDVDQPGRQLHDHLKRAEPRRSWRFAVGRPHAGAYGIARSYQEAREAMTLAERLHPADDTVPTRDLLIYRVLGRDRAALAELVETVLTPLTQARGGAGPLIDTLEAYFASGEVATATARRLHLSVRTVTYRLTKITTLTGYDATVPAQRLTLQAAVIGARLLPWPEAAHRGS